MGSVAGVLRGGHGGFGQVALVGDLPFVVRFDEDRADVLGPASRATMSMMGRAHPACGAGYDMLSGVGAPGPACFSSFGSDPK